MITETLQQLYRACTGSPATAVTELSSAGSNRRYFRLSGPVSLIGTSGTSVEENDAFLYMAAHFRERGLPVPRVYGRSEEGLLYLQEDLGDTSLFEAIGKGRKSGCFDEAERALLLKTIRLLPALQVKGAEGFDFGRCYPQPAFNRRSVLWDLNYFKYCFLKATGLEFQEDRLEDDFQRMADLLLQEETPTFMYRDFQSRNVMVKGGEPWFIDFQGGRRGPVHYDVASFLWQAKARFPDPLRQELAAAYLQALGEYRKSDEKHFFRRLRHFVLFRTLQVLGAYGFRGYFERKPHFLQSVPYAIGNLRQLLQEEFPDYPYLAALLRQLVELPRFRESAGGGPLTVTVVSFAYKNGIPDDPSGNGGGFVFDCRAIHNPGKYERYNRLTGEEEPVARFLEEDGEITRFLEHACEMVDASVGRYMERGFSHLMVCFGCTGGQHRSVYSARHMAEHLHSKFGVRVELVHREQNMKQLFNSII